MEESYPRYHALKYKNEIVKVATMQKSLSPAEALITYQKLDSTLCAFVITNKDLQVHRMPIPADSIIQSFLDLQETLSTLKIILKKLQKPMSTVLPICMMHC